MKILTKKKVDEILKRITANEIIAIESFEDINAYDKVAENNAEMAFLVGGINGMNRIRDTLYKKFNGFI